MKIIGSRSFVYWIKYPFLAYTVGFIAASLWIIALMVYYLITGSSNSNISLTNVSYNNVTQELVQFHYPVADMVLATKNSIEGIVLALLGIASISFILVYAFRIVSKLSREKIFTGSVIKDFKILSYGLIIFGVIILLIDMLVEIGRTDFTPSFFYILVGLILSFMKEVFEYGKNLQEQTDLTI